MQSSIALALLAGAVAGAATSTAAVLLLTPEPAPVPGLVSAPVPDFSSDLGSLRSESRDLAQRMDDLEDRLLMAESMRSVPEDMVARADEEIDARIKDIVTGMRADSPAMMSPLLYQEFEANMRLYEEAQERERDERRQEAMNERLEERLTELTEKLTLAPDQVQSLRLATTSFYKKTTDYFTQARETGDFENARDTMRGFRDEAQVAILSALTPVQQQQYEEADLELLGFGGRDSFRDFSGGGGDFGRR